jgi:hypothetical protein
MILHIEMVEALYWDGVRFFLVIIDIRLELRFFFILLISRFGFLVEKA